MSTYEDKRCPCTRCFIKVNCSEYCDSFHHYRHLVLAEVDYFISKENPDYKYKKNRGGRSMVDIERQLKIAYDNSENKKDRSIDHYTTLRNLTYLCRRFDEVLYNSRKCGRGVYHKDWRENAPT
jgi:hypothetical protein